MMKGIRLEKGQMYFCDWKVKRQPDREGPREPSIDGGKGTWLLRRGAGKSFSLDLPVMVLEREGNVEFPKLERIEKSYVDHLIFNGRTFKKLTDGEQKGVYCKSFCVKEGDRGLWGFCLLIGTVFVADYGFEDEVSALSMAKTILRKSKNPKTIKWCSS